MSKQPSHREKVRIALLDMPDGLSAPEIKRITEYTGTDEMFGALLRNLERHQMIFLHDRRWFHNRYRVQVIKQGISQTPEPIHEIENYEGKRRVLMRLENITSAEIAQVLREIREDLKTINKEAPDASHVG